MTSNWWEILVFCDPLLDELVFWRLENFGCRGTSSELQGNTCLVRAYLPQEQVQLLDLAALSLLLRQDALGVQLPAPMLKWGLIDEEDWADSWKQYWEPQAIGDRFLIYPAWLPIPEQSERVLLRLDPGVAFGTGAHATTQLCLEALEMRLSSSAAMTSFQVGNKPEPQAALTIADVGCGSGILSIGAVLLGAEKVYAVDTDPLAIRSTLSNSELNQVDGSRLIAKQGSVETLQEMLEAPVDGFLCNILAEVIIDLVPQLDAIAKPSTWGIISGVLFEQVKPVADTLEQHGWVIATLWKRQDWCCFNIRRS